MEVLSHNQHEAKKSSLANYYEKTSKILTSPIKFFIIYRFLSYEESLKEALKNRTILMRWNHWDKKYYSHQ